MVEESSSVKVAQLRRIEVVLAAVLLVAGAVWAGGPKFEPGAILLPRLRRTSQPTGVMEDWIIYRMTPAGRKRYLALMEHDVYSWGKWPDEEAMQRSAAAGEAGPKPAPPKTLTDDMVLAVVNDRGMILYRADTPVPHRVNDMANWWRSVPLVMDSTSDCPFAYFDAGGGHLWCYDDQLALKDRYTIPLEQIGYPKVSFDGERYTLWMFGTRHEEASGPKGSENPSRREEEKGAANGDFASRFAVPQRPVSSLGVRYDVRDGSVEPLPVAPGELLADLERIARGPAGQRVHLQPSSITITPFRDPDEDESFGVLIEAVAAKEYRNRALFSGTRLFFRSIMSPQGLGDIEQLSLWLIQEDRPDVVMDERTGVVRAPRFTIEKDLQPFGLGKRDLGIALNAVFKVPREDGTYGNSGRRRQVLFLFSGKGNPPKIVEIRGSALRRGPGRALSADDLTVYPMELTDRVGKYRYAFRTVCENPRDNNDRIPCTALLDLDY